MLDVDADRDSADVRCEDRRQNYRLGDLLSHKFFQMEQRPEDRMHFYCDHCNRSLGCELARRYASSEAARRPAFMPHSSRTNAAYHTKIGPLNASSHGPHATCGVVGSQWTVDGSWSNC